MTKKERSLLLQRLYHATSEAGYALVNNEVELVLTAIEIATPREYSVINATERLIKRLQKKCIQTKLRLS